MTGTELPDLVLVDKESVVWKNLRQMNKDRSKDKSISHVQAMLETTANQWLSFQPR